MTEWVARIFPLAGSPADSLPDRVGKPKPRRFPGFGVGSLFSPAMMAIVGAATVGSLFAAGFVLLMQPMPAEHPTNPPQAAAKPAHPVAPIVAKPSPPVIEHSTLAPASPPPRTTAFSPKEPPPPAAPFAMAEGDARFADGDVPGARFFYEEAADAGNAEGALRLGQTFDPAFLTADRARLVRASVEAARFWYHRALELGAAEAEPRLDQLGTEALAPDAAEAERRPDHLATQARDDRTGTGTRSDRFRHPAVRHYYRTAQRPNSAFYEIPEALHPKTDGP